MFRTHHSPPPTRYDRRPETWTAATLKALAQASALGIPVAFTFPLSREEGRR